MNFSPLTSFMLILYSNEKKDIIYMHIYIR